jgi:hypothetical protein
MFEAERHVLEAENDVRRWEMEVENLVTTWPKTAWRQRRRRQAPEAVQTESRSG